MATDVPSLLLLLELIDMVESRDTVHEARERDGERSGRKREDG